MDTLERACKGGAKGLQRAWAGCGKATAPKQLPRFNTHHLRPFNKKSPHYGGFLFFIFCFSPFNYPCNAAAPLTISVSSVVIAAWRARL
jgi:hypothetical protein